MPIIVCLALQYSETINKVLPYHIFAFFIIIEKYAGYDDDDDDDFMTKQGLISLDDSPFDNLKGYMVRLCINILPCQDANMIMV